MTFISADITQSLERVFNSCDLSLQIERDYFVVNSKDQTRMKIQEIVEKAGFCPLFALNRINHNLAFTITPYAIPHSFDRALSDVEYVYRKGNKKNQQLAKQYQTAYEPHFKENKKNILESAKGLTETALILGLGNGNDIPLIELTQQFQHVTVIDMDLVAMEEAIKDFPLDLKGKIHLVRQDLTGLLSSISSGIEEIISNSSISEKKYVDQIVDIIEKSMKTGCSFALLEKYEFVVSSMLTSQLFSQIPDYLIDILEKKYPHTKEKLFSDFSFVPQNLAEYVCSSHLKHLSDWTLPNGKIYYADTTYIEVIGFDFKKMTPICIEKLNTLPNQEIDKQIEEYFSVIHQISWQWITLPLGICNNSLLQAGNVLNVVARCLKPKESPP